MVCRTVPSLYPVLCLMPRMVLQGRALCRLILPQRIALFKHPLDVHAVSLCRVAQIDMRHRSNDPSILKDRASAHSLNNAARFFKQRSSVTRRIMPLLAGLVLLKAAG